MAPLTITIGKVLFTWARPEIQAPEAMMNGKRLNLDPEITDFDIQIAIKENLVVRASQWGTPITELVNALLTLPRIESIAITVTWETGVHYAGQTLPSTIPTSIVEMIANEFGRLQDVSNAVVSGLGAGPGQALIAKMTGKKEPKTTNRKRRAPTPAPEDDETAPSQEQKKQKKETSEDNQAPQRRYNLRRRLR